MKHTSQKQALMIYNPFSGQRKIHKSFPKITAKLQEMGYVLFVQKVTESKGIEIALKKACTNKWDAIFIAGGDGTINYCLQILAEEENRPQIGIFPFGTSNEIAQYIGVSSSITQALSVIENNNIRPIDIGKFGSQYFVNIASAGWLSDITYKTSPLLKSYIGEWAYVLYFLKTFFMTKQSTPITVNVSTDKVLSDLSLFLIMNGNAVGPFERLITSSTNDDGYFHLLACKKTNRIQLFLILIAKLCRLSNNSSIISHTKIQSGRFSIPDSIALNLDGEKYQIQDFQFKVLPQHLHVFSSQKN
ncbi:YegS/Rv2252/BmrU family lipid kinase [Alteribacillus bidgolensis]|uniref:Diacylglycerol kinase (ATP) n=1 Tax=Alteribacillus bidgolensis TaxID=930129 RepID=A0A1G8CW99_9BACI|nr:YegS/Rv2252/BmrU family lipid kinase [Alteribacillus bidgolensis]SDH49250.1 diacylglycerol kinase (ATP) [Alteribacillus bidgolensis]